MKRLCLVVLLALVTGLCMTARAQVLMRGDADWWTFDDRLYMEVDHITNFDDTPTGELRLRLVATLNRWRDWREGFTLGRRAIRPLDANENRVGIRRKAKLHLPDRRDWYYVTLVLEKRIADGRGPAVWEPLDAIEFDGQYWLEDEWW
jgi:hypothetical protein